MLSRSVTYQCYCAENPLSGDILQEDAVSDWHLLVKELFRFLFCVAYVLFSPRDDVGSIATCRLYHEEREESRRKMYFNQLILPVLLLLAVVALQLLVKR